MELTKRMIKRIKDEFNSQPISFLGAIASIIAFVNIYISMPALFSHLKLPHVSTQIEINLILGLCIFFLLEGSLASFFGFLFLLIRERGAGFPLMLLFLNSLISAWVSGFNCFWIFVPLLHSPDSAVWAFLLMLATAWGIAIYFLRYHFDMRISKLTKSSGGKHIITNPKENNLQQNTTEGSVTEPHGHYNKNFWICFWTQTAGFLFIAIYYGIKIFDLMLRVNLKGTN